MQLLIDLGNTRLKWHLVENGKVSRNVQVDAMTHHKDFESTISHCIHSIKSAEEVWVSNVAGVEAEKLIRHYCQSYLGVQASFAQVKRDYCDIKVAYENLPELGVDRWLAVQGARELIKQGDIVVVNCGTAITVDWLDQDNLFQGGAILPGFDLSLAALNQAAGIDNHVWSTHQERVVGVTTEQCISIGVMSACVGGVERLIDSIRQQCPDIAMLITGGAALTFMGASKYEYEYDANLVIRGLMRVNQ